MESKKINQLATNVNPQTSDLTTIGDPVTGQLKKITWLQVAHLIGAQASLTLQDVTNQGATTTLPITTGGLTLSNLDNGVLKVAGGVVSTYPYGQANGVASLDSGGKVPASQLPSSIMDYKGTWNAATNTPTLVNGIGDTGDVYRCNVAGTVNFGAGNITFKVGDWAIYNGIIWEQSNNSDAVSSVFGRTGDITAQEGDYNIGQLGDVTITSAATNDYLRYNGTGWVNTQFPTFVSSDKLVLQVRNNSGATINKGTVVYINGATAGYPTIAKAQADADNTSAQTLGLVQDNISNNSNGVVVIVGQITGIDTSAYPAGTQLYLSGTTAGAFTSTKTLAPIHLVYVGIVTTQNAVNGVIEVKIQNGYELDEIHDVAISSVANNQGLFYESSTSLWKNKSIATVLGYTPEQPLTFSAPLSRSTNTVSIPAATGSVNGYLSSTDWTTFNNKMDNPMTTLGDIIFGGTSGNPNRLAGNTTTTKQYLSQTGTGTDSASPTWATIAGSDITGAALTKTDDTNVTLTLGGTPATALLRAASLTLGWTGQLSVARGGTGLSALGTAGQLLRVNTGATALEYFTPTYISAAITSLNGLTDSVQTFATGTTGTDFAISSASGVHTFNLPVASATKTGKLSSTDWSTFNGKQDALTNPITGDGTETAGNVAYFTGNTSIAGGSSLFFDTAKGLGINVSGTVNSSLDVGITNTTALLIGNSSDTIVSGDVIGNLSFFSRDGSTNSKGTIASIRSYATTTYNTGSVSGDLRFYVSDSAQPNGSIISGSEALRINPDRSIRVLSYTTNGILKVSGGDGTIGVAVAGDFPTLNQNTTGSAATLTTARNFTINGTAKSFNGSADVSWTAAEIGLTSYLPLAGGTLSGQLILKEGTDSADYTKGLRFPNDPYGGSGDVSGLRLYRSGTTGENQVLELYVGNDGGDDSINFRIGVGGTANNDAVKINGNKIWNEANDGTGSGLDADLLDGNHASAFQLALTNPVTGTGSASRLAYWNGNNSITSTSLLNVDTTYSALVINATGIAGYSGVQPKLEVYGSNLTSADPDGGNIVVYGTANTANSGAAITLGASFTTGYGTFARVRAVKANSTSGDSGGGIALDVRPSNGGFQQALIINSSRQATFESSVTATTSVTAGDNILMNGGEFYFGGSSSDRKVRLYTTGAEGSATLNYAFWNGTTWPIKATLDYNGAATFSSSISATSATFSGIVGVNGASEAGWALKSNGNLKVESGSGTTVLQVNDTSTGGKTWSLISAGAGNTHSIPAGTFYLRNSSDGSTAFQIASTGAATFSSTVISPQFRLTSSGTFRVNTNADAILGYLLRSGSWKGNTENNLALATDGDFGISFFTNGTTSERLFIKSDGFIGINETNPTTYGRFTVNTGSSNNTIPIFNLGYGTTLSNLVLRNTYTRANGILNGIEFRDSSNEVQASIYANPTGSNNQSHLIFATNNGTGGNGLTGATERLRVRANGSLLIGTVNDSSGRRFFNYDGGTGNANGFGLDMAGNSYEASIFFAYGVSDSGRLTFGSHDGTTYRTKMTVMGTGEVWVGYTTDQGNYLLQVNGAVQAASGFYDTSDMRIKNIIERNPNIKLDLDLIKYTKKDDEFNTIRYGYIAQEVQKLMPELVGGKEILSLNYQDVHSVLIYNLMNRIKQLESKLN